MVTSSDAEAGLREIETLRPDVVLIDLRVPLVDGVRLLRQMRARDHQRHTPIAIITADYRVPQTIDEELKELQVTIAQLNELLGSKPKRMALIKSELTKIGERFGDAAPPGQKGRAQLRW